MGWAVSCRGEVAVTRVSLSWQNLKQWEMLQFYINFVTEILFFWVTIMSVVKALVFPGVTYGWKARTINKVHLWHGWCQRIDAFELWCCRRLLKVLWPGRRLNQSILREINPEYSLEGLMLKLKLQYFGYLMRITDSLEKSLMLGKIEVRRRRGH